jgi:hypothetical protein
MNAARQSTEQARQQAILQQYLQPGRLANELFANIGGGRTTPESFNQAAAYYNNPYFGTMAQNPQFQQMLEGLRNQYNQFTQANPNAAITAYGNNLPLGTGPQQNTAWYNPNSSQFESAWSANPWGGVNSNNWMQSAQQQQQQQTAQAQSTGQQGNNQQIQQLMQMIQLLGNIEQGQGGEWPQQPQQWSNPIGVLDPSQYQYLSPHIQNLLRQQQQQGVRFNAELSGNPRIIPENNNVGGNLNGFPTGGLEPNSMPILPEQSGGNMPLQNSSLFPTQQQYYQTPGSQNMPAQNEGLFPTQQQYNQTPGAGNMPLQNVSSNLFPTQQQYSGQSTALAGQMGGTNPLTQTMMGGSNRPTGNSLWSWGS